jgi:hypothetical protein
LKFLNQNKVNSQVIKQSIVNSTLVNNFSLEDTQSNTNMFMFIKRNFLKNKKLSFVDMFLRNSCYSGKKLKILNSCNIVSLLFFSNFIKKSNFLNNKFSNYNIFYNFSKSNEFFFDFNYILENIVNLNESIFITRVNKTDKKLKKKAKSKFNLELKYLNKFKRQNNVVKLLNLYSNNFNYYNFPERLLTSVVTTLFEQKNSDLYKKKIYTYNMVLKKKSVI